MTLENIYYIGQTIAVIVIIATLIALLWQGFQTNKIARADLTLSVWMQSGAMNQALLDTPEDVEFMTRLFDPNAKFTPEDMVRLAANAISRIGFLQAAFTLRKSGLIEETTYGLIVNNVGEFLKSPIAGRWWKHHRNDGYDAELCAVIDALVAQHAGEDAAGKHMQDTRN